jgi:hypothetical protein
MPSSTFMTRAYEEIIDFFATALKSKKEPDSRTKPFGSSTGIIPKRMTLPS